MRCPEFSKSTLMTKKPKRPTNNIEPAAGSHRFDVAALRDLAGEKIYAGCGNSRTAPTSA
jgi:hypothetical protein